MEITGIQLILLIAGLSALIYVINTLVNKIPSANKKATSIFKKQALKRKGRLQEGPLLKFTFTHKNLEVGVEITSTTVTSGYRSSRVAVSSTAVKTEFNKEFSKEFHIYPEKSLHRVEKALGFQDIRLGDDLFDRAYMIKSNDEAFIRTVFTPTVRHRLLKCKEDEVDLILVNKCFSLSVPYTVLNEQQIDRLIDAALTVVDRINEII